MLGPNKFLKFFKVDLVSCFTILFSVRAPTIHLPDLLSSSSNLIAFHESWGSPIHSGSFQRIFCNFSFLPLHHAILKMSLSTWSLHSLYFSKEIHLLRSTSLKRLLYFWNLSIKKLLRIRFDFLNFNRCYSVNDLH